MKMKEIEISKEIMLAASHNIKERDYWLNKLSGYLEKSSFQDTGKKPVLKECKIESKKFKLYGELFSNLMKISKNSDYRLHILLVAVTKLLLHKYSGNKDILIGIPTYKQHIKGELINTVLVLRSQVKPDMTFKDFLMQIAQTVFEANENQNYPIEILMRKLNMSFSEDNFPLFDVAILLENIHDKRYLQHIKLNMIVSFFKTEEDIEGVLEYNSSLYDKTSIESILVHFNLLLDKVLHNTNLKIAGLDILTGEEKKRLIEFNKTQVDYPKDKTIHELFENVVEKAPDRTAIVCEDRVLTYKELNEKANQLARKLRQKHVTRDILVGLLMDRSPTIIIGILGILKAGGAYMAIAPGTPGNRIISMLEESQTSLLLVDYKRYHQFIAFAAQKINWKSKFPGEILVTERLMEALPGEPAGNLEHINNPKDLVYVIYTSGSTGKPKGVMIEHRGLVNYINWAANRYVKNEHMNFPLFTSISFDLTVTSLFTPLITGNGIVIFGEESSELQIERIIEDDRIGIVKLTPSHLKMIWDKKIGKEGSTVKRFIVGGEDLEMGLARRIYKNFNGNVEIYNEYGPTETVVGSMSYEFNSGKDNRDSVPIGIPIDNTKIYVMDLNQNPLPPGAVGEIHISGDGAARGYLNMPELTREKFVEDPFTPGKRMYRSGDLAKWLSNGNMEFIGRIDRQVKIKGFRIETAEIEYHLLKRGKVKEVVVIASERQINGESIERNLCAYIVPTDNLIDIVQLKEDMAKDLPGYMIPSYIVLLEKIPLTPNGKVDRKAFPEPGLLVSKEEYEAPRNKLEKILVEIWSEVLGLRNDTIGIDSSFFELGGHSLKATILASRIHKEMNVKIPMGEIFKNPTIRGLSAYVKKTAQNMYITVEPAEKKEYYPLSSAQKRLYIINQVEKENTSYNISLSIIVEGVVKKEMVQETFEKLIKRHQSFETSFQLVKGQPVQIIHDTVDFALEYYESGDAEAKQICQRFISPFDLSKAPLLRVAMIKIEEMKCIMMIDMHHIISDEVSTEIFVLDFKRLYKGEKLPPLKYQYKDFSQWHNKGLKSEEVKSQERYWINRFKGEIQVLELPTDYPEAAGQHFEGGNLVFEIDEELTGKLRLISMKSRVTLYMLLLGIFSLLLSKYTGQYDIIIGSPTAGRRHADSDNIIGMFINVFLIRSFPAPKKTFDEFLMEVKRATLEAFENQDYQFDDLLERLKIKVKRDSSKNPLYSVIFAFQDGKKPKVEIQGLKLKPYGVEKSTAKTELRLGAIETQQTIHMKLTYVAARFKPETIEKIARHYIEIVKQVVKNTTVKLGDIKIPHELITLKSNTLRSNEGEFDFSW